MSAFDPTNVRKAVSELTPRHQQKFENLLPSGDGIVAPAARLHSTPFRPLRLPLARRQTETFPNGFHDDGVRVDKIRSLKHFAGRAARCDWQRAKVRF